MGSEKDSMVDQIDFWEKILYKILYDVSENGFQKKSKEKNEKGGFVAFEIENNRTFGQEIVFRSYHR